MELSLHNNLGKNNIQDNDDGVMKMSDIVPMNKEISKESVDEYINEYKSKKTKEKKIELKVEKA